MAVNWTREQKQVIEGREKSLLVSAAAGSGCYDREAWGG